MFSADSLSLLVQGLIEFLAIANHPVAKMLRDNVVFKIVPMINPDGVFLGNNRCNSVGHDMNRYWANISTFTHPTLRATLDLLMEYNCSDVSGALSPMIVLLTLRSFCRDTKSTLSSTFTLIITWPACSLAATPMKMSIVMNAI
jgi:Zinc carboxypeptidase